MRSTLHAINQFFQSEQCVSSNRCHRIVAKLWRPVRGSREFSASPNSDTPYSWLGADLRAEPIVITVPEVERRRSWTRTPRNCLHRRPDEDSSEIELGSPDATQQCGHWREADAIGPRLPDSRGSRAQRGIYPTLPFLYLKNEI